MKVLYFGTYERDYPRNAQVISCLRRADVDVEERHVALWDGQRHKFGIGVGVLPRMVAAEVRLVARTSEDADAILVGYPGHADMLAARRVARGRPVVFNPLVSLEDTMVDDRRLLRRSSMRARATRMVDRLAFKRADHVVADTEAHAQYFRQSFGLSADRVSACLVGADDRIFYPAERSAREFEVLFVGTLIPLHGLDTILAAADECAEIRFRIVGSGQLQGLLADTPPNVICEPWVDYKDLPDLYRRAGCALGIFGTSGKATRVIPNKAFHALATQTALITADTPAARELLRNEHDAVLVPAGDSGALAAAVRRLASHPHVRDQIAARGRITYMNRSSEEVLGRQWRALLERLIAVAQATTTRASPVRGGRKVARRTGTGARR